MRKLYIDNYVIEKPLIEVINTLRLHLTNGKLKDIKFSNGSDDIVVTCPHHDFGHENVPDCNIYVGDDNTIQYGFCHCFACGFKAPFTKFVAECFEKSEAYAKEWLITNFGVECKNRIFLGDPIDIKRSTNTNNHYYDKSILEKFQSYCPYLQKRNISLTTCKELQIKYDPITRTVIFPCFDLQDNLIMMPSRSIDFKRFTLDKDVDKPVYCLNEIIKRGITDVVLTEGPFDVATSWTYGMPAIGTMGTVSDSQIDLINKSGLRHIYLMFDNDDAGKRFTEKLIKRLKKTILYTVVNIPEPYKDINNLSKEQFWNCLDKAKQNDKINILKKKNV